MVSQTDCIQDLGRNILVWVYLFNHKVKQPPEWFRDVAQTSPGATGDIGHHRPPSLLLSLSLSLLCVSQWSSDRCVYQSGGESGGIKPGADACSCIYQITGRSGWWGSLCVGRVFWEGYAGVTAGSGGGGRGRVESYDLKETFL